MAEKLTKRKKQKLIKYTIGAVCLIILALIWYFINPNENENYEVPKGTAEIHFIDVGQGDATLIKVGDKNVLIDTGEKSAKDELLAYLNDHSVKEIEYFVVTHFDTDHFGNGIDVLENYDVKKLLIPDQVKTTASYENFIDKATEQQESKDIEVLNANEMIGEKLLINELELTILAPLKDDYDDSNDFSIVLMARYGNKRVLLSGDAEKEAEEDIVSKYSTNDLNCDVFKLGHHGSRTSSSQELLDLATPEYVVASCGVDNKYGHPHSEVLKRIKGMKLYRTDEQGSIVFSISSDLITVRTEK